MRQLVLTCFENCLQSLKREFKLSDKELSGKSQNRNLGEVEELYERSELEELLQHKHVELQKKKTQGESLNEAQEQK